jgi:hypothetical protein
VLVPHPALLHPRRGPHPELAAWTAGWVERIASLYVAHTAITATELGSPERTWAEAQFSAELNTIDAARTAQSAHPELLHPAAAKVLATLDREWQGLARHRDYPELPLDNNTSERALRGPVVGARTTTAPARWSPPSWPAGSSPSPPPPREPGSIRWLTSPPTSTRAPAPAHRPHRTGADPVPAWAVNTDDLTAWAHRPRPQPDTTKPDTTGSDTSPAGEPHPGPAP